MMVTQDTFQIAGREIEPGESADLTLKISEHYCGTPIHLPLRVMRGIEAGPALFVAGAIHGDELNGAGIVRELIVNKPPVLTRGSLVLLPVVNMLGFERHERYLPDRRDLNRSFPGSKTGSLTARLARAIIEEVVRKCDYGIDLHTAANFRTTIPNIRVDPACKSALRIARAFGCELIVLHRGPLASLRRVACSMGCATIILEAGETWTIDPQVVEVGAQGVRNVLMALGMMEGRLVRPAQSILVRRRVWLRAAEAGLLHMHVTPGQHIEPGDAIASNMSLLGKRRSVLRAQVRGIIMGLTTRPSVKPGDPICHIAILE